MQVAALDAALVHQGKIGRCIQEAKKNYFNGIRLRNVVFPAIFSESHAVHCTGNSQLCQRIYRLKRERN